MAGGIPGGRAPGGGTGGGKSQEEACLVEEAQTPVMIPQDLEQTVEGGICKELMRAVSLGEWVLCCQKSFSC